MPIHAHHPKKKPHSHDHGSEHDHHDHAHDHSNAPVKILLFAVVTTFCFALIEAVAGWYTHALVLMSDAGHMASDSLALGIAAFAAWIASRPPSAKHSYGLGRAEVIGAWLSSLLMVIVVIAIVIEAVERFSNPRAVSGAPVIWVASIGLLVNITIAYALSRGEKSLNVRAAIIHVLGDILGSIAALISGAVIYFKGWMTIDPILSIFICILILFSSLQLLRESLLVLMEGVPPHLDLAQVEATMIKVRHVRAVHDLHIWTLSSGVIMLSAHIELDNMNDWHTVFTELQEIILHQYQIEHVTLQPELPLEGLSHVHD